MYIAVTDSTLLVSVDSFACHRLRAMSACAMTSAQRHHRLGEYMATATALQFKQGRGHATCDNQGPFWRHIRAQIQVVVDILFTCLKCLLLARLH
jgi:hypothetical protein